MKRRAVLIADEDDRLAVNLRRRLGNGVAIQASGRFPDTHFTIGSDGRVEGVIVVDGRPLDFGELSGVVFRPGRAWTRQRTATTLRQAFNRHERHAAWSAWLAALPCPVANRLPPSWFLSPDLHGVTLARSFAAAAGLNPGQFRDRKGRSDLDRAYFVGAEFVSESGLGDDFRLSAHYRSRVERWCVTTGTVLGAIEIHRGPHGPEVESVQPVPALRNAPPRVIDRLCRLLVARFA